MSRHSSSRVNQSYICMSLELNPSNIKCTVSGSVRGDMIVIILNTSAWPYNYISQLSGLGFCEHGKVGLENHGLDLEWGWNGQRDIVILTGWSIYIIYIFHIDSKCTLYCTLLYCTIGLLHLALHHSWWLSFLCFHILCMPMCLYIVNYWTNLLLKSQIWTVLLDYSTWQCIHLSD